MMHIHGHCNKACQGGIAWCCQLPPARGKSDVKQQGMMLKTTTTDVCTSILHDETGREARESRSRESKETAKIKDKEQSAGLKSSLRSLSNIRSPWGNQKSLNQPHCGLGGTECSPANTISGVPLFLRDTKKRNAPFFLLRAFFSISSFTAVLGSSAMSKEREQSTNKNLRVRKGSHISLLPSKLRRHSYPAMTHRA